MSEGRTISKPIIDAVNAMPGGKAIKLPGGPYMEVGTPDLLCAVDGRTYLLESKKRRKPEVIQVRRLIEWHAAGVITGVVYSEEEALAAIGGDAAALELIRSRYEEMMLGESP
jgi:hypothetical protein